MEIQVNPIIDLIKSDYDEAYKQITSDSDRPKKVKEYKEEFDGKRDFSGRNQVGQKRDKQVGAGADKKTVITAKLKASFQKKVVNTATAFLVGSPIALTPNDENETSERLLDEWDSLRMDLLLKDFVKTVKSETEASLFFFIKDAPEGSEDKFQLKARLMTSKNGSYYPTFDEYDDLIAFTWAFTGLDESGKEIPKAWTWTAENEYHMAKTSTGWIAEESKANEFKKIPVVYMSQDSPEWFDVKEMIDRFELLVSNLSDTNDYFGAPILKLFGEVEGMPNKEDQGKALRMPQTYEDGKLTKGGDAEYLTWSHSPESTKVEFEMLLRMIYSMTSTPDLSLDNLKGMSQVSGIALKLMFLDPILKAKDSEGVYSQVVDRIISLIKAGIGNVVKTSLQKSLLEVKFEKEFTSILPDNLLETIQMLAEATAGKPTLSQERAVQLNPLSQEGDLELIKEESKQDLGESFNEVA